MTNRARCKIGMWIAISTMSMSLALYVTGTSSTMCLTIDASADSTRVGTTNTPCRPPMHPVSPTQSEMRHGCAVLQKTSRRWITVRISAVSEGWQTSTSNNDAITDSERWYASSVQRPDHVTMGMGKKSWASLLDRVRQQTRYKALWMLPTPCHTYVPSHGPLITLHKPRWINF